MTCAVEDDRIVGDSGRRATEVRETARKAPTHIRFGNIMSASAHAQRDPFEARLDVGYPEEEDFDTKPQLARPRHALRMPDARQSRLDGKGLTCRNERIDARQRFASGGYIVEMPATSNSDLVRIDDSHERAVEIRPYERRLANAVRPTNNGQDWSAHLRGDALQPVYRAIGVLAHHPAIQFISDRDALRELRFKYRLQVRGDDLLGASGMSIGYHAPQGLVGRIAFGYAHVRILP